MPNVSYLQNKYKNEVQIFLVTSEDSSDVIKFYSRRSDLKALKLPIVTMDSTLCVEFPHESIPHIVWIGKDRKVKAITYGRYLNEDNLNILIRNNRLFLPTKKDLLNFGYEDLFAVNPNIDLKNILLQGSSITRQIRGIRNMSGIFKLDSTRKRIFAFNLTIPMLYAMAYRHRIHLSSNEIKTRIRFDKSNPLFKTKFCYESVFQDKGSAQDEIIGFRQMINDLNEYFNLDSKISTVKTKCYAITFTKPFKPNNLGSETFIDHIKYVELKDVTPSSLLTCINDFFKPTIPIVFTGPSNCKININLPKHIPSIEALKADLNKYGLDIERKDEFTEMIIITHCLKRKDAD
jgi:hypothetical protein